MQTDTNTSSVNVGTAHLFSPLTIGDITLRNRIGVSPMCQYGSVDGFASDWHFVHLGSRAVGGAALVIVEASAVEPIGRISPDDLGIWKDEHIPALAKITAFVKEYGAVPGIQIAHAGRKASTLSPWKAGSREQRRDLTDAEGGWDFVGPSAVPFSPSSRTPKELTVAEIHAVQDKFVAAAQRALQAGFQWLEIHSAHGYLLNSFYSPLSNFRTDQYGGSFENRVRMLIETVRKVRAVWPSGLPLSVRISASDWAEGGWTVDDSVLLARLLKDEGVDVVDASSGAVRPGDKYPIAPGWQVPLAEQIRREAKIKTAAVGMITDAKQANEIIAQGRADIVLLARQMIRDPHWPYHAALALGQPVENTLPRRYLYAV
jgi:2,4-dienoyl-CoA reductase-like NADH-dependent reductase (Old Yellow Enzyme family)